MPLIKKPAEAIEKIQTRIRLSQDVKQEMEAYCQWANISFDYFIEQAAKFLFSKDKDWQKNKS